MLAKISQFVFFSSENLQEVLNIKYSNGGSVLLIVAEFYPHKSFQMTRNKKQMEWPYEDHIYAYALTKG